MQLLSYPTDLAKSVYALCVHGHTRRKVCIHACVHTYITKRKEYMLCIVCVNVYATHGQHDILLTTLH